MKTSVSSYSFGGYFGSLGYLGIIDKAKEIGFDGIEYTDGGYMAEPDSAKKIKERCAELGLETVALAVGANFLAADLEGEIERLKKMVDYAAEVGFKMMRHDVAGGYGPDKKHSRGYDNALPIIAKGVREVAAYAEQKGVRTMTENHGYFSQDAARVEKLINTVAHDNFGALVDMGNFMCADEDPSLSVSIMAPYAFHVHAKDFLLKEGNMFSLKTCCQRHQDERCLDTDPVFFVFFSLHTDDAVQSTDTQDTAEVTAFINSGEAMGWSHEGHCLQLKADMGSNANSATDISVRLGKLCNITGVQFPCL